MAWQTQVIFDNLAPEIGESVARDLAAARRLADARGMAPAAGD